MLDKGPGMVSRAITIVLFTYQKWEKEVLTPKRDNDYYFLKFFNYDFIYYLTGIYSYFLCPNWFTQVE
jgi:hypothetical protein